MDGFGKDSNVIVIAATNRPDVLDPALLRAGRFDRQVDVAPPDRKGRTRCSSSTPKTGKVGADVDFVTLGRRTPGLTGADIANLVNQAALEAARAGREEISPEDFAEAVCTVYMGRGRKSAEVPQWSREVTAWHEAGHAVASLVLPQSDDPMQVTIVPRGMSGGTTWYGVDDESFYARSAALAKLVVLLAGRAGEELLLDGDYTQGPVGDIASATGLAQRMVMQWGMSSLGLAAVVPQEAGSGLSERVHAEVDRFLTDGAGAGPRPAHRAPPLLRGRGPGAPGRGHDRPRPPAGPAGSRVDRPGGVGVGLAPPPRRRVAGCCPPGEIFIVMYVPPAVRPQGTSPPRPNFVPAHPSGPRTETSEAVRRVRGHFFPAVLVTGVVQVPSSVRMLG